MRLGVDAKGTHGILVTFENDLDDGHMNSPTTPILDSRYPCTVTSPASVMQCSRVCKQRECTIPVDIEMRLCILHCTCHVGRGELASVFKLGTNGEPDLALAL